MRCCQFRHNFNCIECLCKRRKRIFNLTELTSKFYAFFQKKIWKLLTYHTPYHYKVINSQKQSGFGPPILHNGLPLCPKILFSWRDPKPTQYGWAKNWGHCFWLAWFLACFNAVLFWMHLLTLYWRDLQHKRCHQPVFRYTQGKVKSQSL